MVSDVQISPDAAASAGALLENTADDAAAAGSKLLAAGESISGTVEAGAWIHYSATAFGQAVGGVCADLVESATGLGSLVRASAQTYASTESSATNSFAGMTPR